MAAETGRAFVIKLTDGTSPVVYAQLGGLRATGLTIANTTVDITTKDDDNWRLLLANAGDRSVSLSGSGIFKDSSAETLMRGFALDGSINTMQIEFEDNDYFEGDFQVANLEYTGEYNGAREYSVTLESSGEVTYN